MVETVAPVSSRAGIRCPSILVSTIAGFPTNVVAADKPVDCPSPQAADSLKAGLARFYNLLLYGQPARTYDTV